MFCLFLIFTISYRMSIDHVFVSATIYAMMEKHKESTENYKELMEKRKKSTENYKELMEKRKKSTEKVVVSLVSPKQEIGIHFPQSLLNR